jgi:peptidoglycan/LPS O-acetylase OafA/YrhL
LLLPWAFLAWQRWGTTRFLLGLAAIEVLAFLARYVLVQASAPHPIIWVTPYLRPESILLGLVLAVVRPRWNPLWSLAAFTSAAVVFVNTPRIVLPQGMLYCYVPAGIMVASLMDASMRFSPLRAALSWGLLRDLGKISYGLYVLHVWAIATVLELLVELNLDIAGPRLGILALSMTVGVAIISYHYLERPFLKIKSKYAAVEGRAI